MLGWLRGRRVSSYVLRVDPDRLWFVGPFADRVDAQSWIMTYRSQEPGSVVITLPEHEVERMCGPHVSLSDLHEV